MLNIKILCLPHFYELPTYATQYSAGMDLYAANQENLELKKNHRMIVPTGICIELPENCEAQVRSRSGLSFKNAVVVLNSPGTIDADYRGEIKIILANFGEEDFIIKRGMRIAQLIISKYEKINWIKNAELSQTERSDKGFGSTNL